MSEQGRLADLDEIHAIICDPQKLYNYKSEQNWMKPEFNTFVLDLPTTLLNECVKEEMQKLYVLLSGEAVNGVQIEHIGSTAIPGMPGTKNPDLLMTVDNYPPNKGVIKALLESGFSLKEKPMKGPISKNISCLWFIKYISEEPLSGQFFKIHVCKSGSRTERYLLHVKDLLLNDHHAFETYRRGKIEASKWICSDYKKYKSLKAQYLPNLSH